MTRGQRVLLLGGTGRTGRLVLEQLLDRGAAVTAIVRSAARLPQLPTPDTADLTVVEADLLNLDEPELDRHVDGCSAVISCLGHRVSLRGVYGPPWDLVTQATTQVCRSVQALRPSQPVEFVLMSSVSVNHPAGLDRRRGGLEKAALWGIRRAIPPAKDNQRAADFLHETIGTDNRSLEWVVVRPDSLEEGDVSEYAVHETLVHSLFAPGSTRMANVAHFMCELATRPAVWERWRGAMPAIVDRPLPGGAE